MSCCGTGKFYTFLLEDNRLITVDIDCDEEWGDINISKEGANYSIGVGNDEDGYVKVAHIFKELDPNCDPDYITTKWQTLGVVDPIKFVENYLVRLLAFSDGYTFDELKSDLAYHGIDYKTIRIPEILWCYLTDEDKKELPYVG